MKRKSTTKEISGLLRAAHERGCTHILAAKMGATSSKQHLIVDQKTVASIFKGHLEDISARTGQHTKMHDVWL